MVIFGMPWNLRNNILVELIQKLCAYIRIQEEIDKLKRFEIKIWLKENE